VGPLPASQADIVEGQRRATLGYESGEEPIEDDARPGAQPANGHHGDHLDADADAAADTEEADESGEEKISSAVFMPHQEIPDARAAAADAVGSAKVQRPRSVSHSSSHPWLVKADEPEPEPEVHEEDEAAAPAESLLTEHRETAMLQKPSPDVQETSSEATIALESASTNGGQTTPSAPPNGTHYEDHVHHHQHHPRQPLEAIELIPYKHQVGGHTTIWRFSRRAVCKQLNNRENEFYETIERYHRDLLPFLPR
jgi:hypothetical protein